MAVNEQDRLRDALAVYFRDNGFKPDGGYHDDWVRIEVLRIPFYIPNTRARKRVLPHHDLHHVVTGYATTLVGEGEIGAWELASGCERFFVAWWLNLLAMSVGLVVAPGKMFRAFVHGRRTRNTYRLTYGDALLARTVASLRGELGLEAVPGDPANAADRAAFAGFSVASLAVGLVTSAVYAAPVVALLWGAAWALGLA
jgi:hypothetical protein